MSPGPVLSALRTATRIAHDRLERQLDAINAFAIPARRRSLVRRYYLLHVPAEAHLAVWLAAVPELEFARRRRAPLILEALDRLAIALPASGAPPLPAVRSRAEALGFLYVLEGSSLGGRVILRSLARRGVEAGPLRFLDPYEGLAGELWGQFIRVLERETPKHRRGIELAVSGAVAGFAYAEACLCQDALAA